MPEGSDVTGIADPGHQPPPRPVLTMNQDPVRDGRHRWVDLAFGLFLIAMAVAIVIVAEAHTAGVLVATVVLGGFGVDCLLAAVGRRASLLSRIGPLP